MVLSPMCSITGLLLPEALSGHSYSGVKADNKICENSVLQSAVHKISLISTPFSEAAVLEAPRTEWALKTDVSTPTFPSIFFIQ